MIVKQRVIMTYETVNFDEEMAYSRNDSGAYFYGEGFEPVESVKDVVKAYMEAGHRIPDAFSEARALIANLL